MSSSVEVPLRSAASTLPAIRTGRRVVGACDKELDTAPDRQVSVLLKGSISGGSWTGPAEQSSSQRCLAIQHLPPRSG
jgi:hypothetical protein